MTDHLVIDTNVAISANGRDTHASPACQYACIELLEDCRQLHIAVDKLGLIMEEYAKHLNYSGQPGVGDIFFKYLHDYQYATEKIYRVDITPCEDSHRGFKELPLNQLDSSDRKFLATAIVAEATIINATDSDWEEQNDLLKRIGINVRQLCL